MKSTSLTFNPRLADVVFLGICGIFAALCFVSTFRPIGGFSPWYGLVAGLAMLESIQFGWLGLSPVESGRRGAAIHFGALVQLQALIQVYAATYFSACLIYLLISGLNNLHPDPTVTELLAPDGLKRANGFLFPICGLVAWTIAMLRMHDLRRRGHSLAELGTGKYTAKLQPVMARPDVAAQRLRHYLEALKSDGSPALYWFRYGKRPTIVQVGATPAQFECTWMWCPIKVVFTVLSRDGSSAVEVKFKLRGGYFRIELFPNPVDVMHLTEYLDGQVLKLLDSELTLTEARERQESLRLQALEMQLRMLQSQVEPHFLFNTMANLRQLYRTDIVAGEAMLDHLIGYLRGAMQDLRADVTTVSKEFELAMHFLSIMKVRMGDRLAYQFICHDGAGSYSFPPAMLISLVENAVKHGLRDAKAGQLRITAAVDDGKLRVSVVDNGPGFSSVEGTGLGLSNIRQRLEAIYGMRAWLEVGAPADGGFISSIVVPAEPALQPQQEPQLS